MFLLFLPILILGAIAGIGLLTVGASRLGNSEVRRPPRLNQPVRIARNDEFVPQSIPQYLEREGSPVTQGLTNIINEHRRQTPNGPLFVCIGEQHGHSSRMGESISEFFQTYSRNLTPEQRNNVTIAIELDPSLDASLEILERVVQADIGDCRDLFRVAIAARRAGFQVVFANFYSNGNRTTEGANARETTIYNNVNGLTQGLTNPTIFYYGGSAHCSRTSHRIGNIPTAIPTLATRLISTHGDNSVVSVRSVDELFGFDGVHQSTPHIDTVIPPGSNSVIAPIGGPIRNESGTYDYIITSPSVRR